MYILFQQQQQRKRDGKEKKCIVSIAQMKQRVKLAYDAANSRSGQYTKHKDASTMTDNINI